MTKHTGIDSETGVRYSQDVQIVAVGAHFWRWECGMCGFVGDRWRWRAGAVADAQLHAVECARLASGFDRKPVTAWVVDEHGERVRPGVGMRNPVTFDYREPV